VIVAGAVAAARRWPIHVTLVGPASILEREVARYPDAATLPVAVVDAPDAVQMAEAPGPALRHKPGASIRVAASLVARGEAEALYSAGNTGATVLATHGALGMLRGVDRPALASAIPTKGRPAVLLDLGANAVCRPRHLVQFAAMGVVYARVALGVDRPRVGLLSIGEEETKGNDLTRETHRLLKAAPLQFIGNIEARDVYSGQSDVIVCDGFTGNIAIKVSEGVVDMVASLIRADAEVRRRRTAPVSRAVPRAFGRLRRRLDASEYGGAPLLGIAGVCIVGHGRSSARAVRNAIALAARFARDDVAGRIEREIAAMGDFES